jgi:hypothetical protein
MLVPFVGSEFDVGLSHGRFLPEGACQKIRQFMYQATSRPARRQFVMDARKDK